MSFYWDISCADCGQFAVEKKPIGCPRCYRKDAIVLYHPTELEAQAKAYAKEVRNEYERRTTPEVTVHLKRRSSCSD